MAAKNTIRVKIQFEKEFLCACLKAGITPKQRKVIDDKFLHFGIQVIYYQDVFQLGYYFYQFTNEGLPLMSPS